jgi:PAS domain S-box-containing protein
MVPGDHFEFQEEIILVADKDESVRRMAKEVLRQSGFLITTVEDGVEALSHFEQIHPDVVLLEILIPRMDGFEICNRIRRQPGGFYTPILMVAEHEDGDSINRAFAMGATDFVTKPINWTVLTHRVRYSLRAAKAIHRRIESEAKNRALVEAIPDMILQIRRDGTVLDCRPAIAIDPVVPPEELLGNRIQDVLPSHISQRYIQSVEKAFESNRIQRFEYSVPKEGSEDHFEARIVVYGEDKVVGIIRDVTDQRHLQGEERPGISEPADGRPGVFGAGPMLPNSWK